MLYEIARERYPDEILHYKSQVAMIGEFDPDKPRAARRRPFGDLTFKNGGATDDPIRIWSGEHLLDIECYQALRMKPKMIGGTDYLFIEAGGFNNRQKEG